MPRRRVIVAVVLALVLGLAAGVAVGQDDSRVRPVSELSYVEVRPGDSYWALARDLGLSCTYTELWAANGRIPLDPGTILVIPPRCAPVVTPPTTTPVTTAPPTTVPETTTTTTPPTTTTTTTTTTVAPPPPADAPLIGASIEKGTFGTQAAATAAFEAQTGAPAMIARRFIGSFPTNFANVEAFSVDTGKRHRWISVKGDPTLAQWITFLGTIPQDGFDTWVTINHEPENDGGSMTPTVFKSRLALMSTAIDQVNRDDIHKGLILMTWLERDNDATTSSASWFPDSDILPSFTLGIDPYDPNSRNTFASLVSATIALWDAAGGHDWMVTEVGTKRTGQAGVDWIAGMGSYCRADPDCKALMWFHAAAGDNGPWYLPTGAMSAEWGRQVTLSLAAQSQFSIAA